MKLSLRLLGVILAGALSAAAGSVYITLRAGNGPLSNVDVDIVCANRRMTVRTGAEGSFRIHAENGKCTLSVPYDGQRPEAVFFSYEDPTEYYFTLTGNRERGYRFESAARH